jgi:hypothetical protein
MVKTNRSPGYIERPLWVDNGHTYCFITSWNQKILQLLPVTGTVYLLI